MSNPDRTYANWLVQLLSVLFLTLYYYLTEPAYSNNIIFFIISILLFSFGLFRKINETLLVSLAAILIYGVYILYQIYVTLSIASIAWNDLIWLVVFPFMALIGGIGRPLTQGNSNADSSPFFMQLPTIDDQKSEELCTINDNLAYLNGTSFVYKLEEEVIKSLRERRKISLFVVEIGNFKEYKKIFGTDHAQYILNKTAEFINDVPNQMGVKAQIGEGTIAIIMTNVATNPTDADPLVDVKELLNESFYSMMLIRPRREGAFSIKLKFANAICPIDGIEARSLLEKVQSELEWNGV